MYFKLLLQMGHLWFLLQPGSASSLSFILCCGREEKGKLRLGEKYLHLIVCDSSVEPVGNVLTPSAHPRSCKLPHNQTTQSRRRRFSGIFPLAWSFKFNVTSPSDRHNRYGVLDGKKGYPPLPESYQRFQRPSPGVASS